MAVDDQRPISPAPRRDEVDRGVPSTSQLEQEVVGFFDELRGPLYRYFLCTGLSRDDASECVQETFLRLYRHLQRRGDHSNLRGWIFQVARNLIRDEYKSARRGRTETLDSSIERLSACPDPEGSPEDQMLRRERLHRLRSSIEKLTPQQRNCVLLRVAGLRYREIAEMLGIGISSVGELMQRAIARLNEDLYE